MEEDFNLPEEVPSLEALERRVLNYATLVIWNYFEDPKTGVAELKADFEALTILIKVCDAAREMKAKIRGLE